MEALENRTLLASLWLEERPEDLEVRHGIRPLPDLRLLMPPSAPIEPVYSEWSNVAAATTWEADLPPRAGDANMDGQVDGSDYAVLDANVGVIPVAWAHGDVNLDGTVDGSDYAILDANAD